MKKFITLTGSISLSMLLVFIFMAGGQAEKKNVKDMKSIRSEDKQYGFRFACPGGPGKTVKIKGASYDDALKLATNQAVKEGCANAVNLYYMEGSKGCQDAPKYRVKVKLWVVNESNLEERIDQKIIAKGFNPKCGNGSSYVGGIDKEKSSKAALDDAQDEVTWL